MPKKLISIFPRGFCAGVERAVLTVERALEIYKPPIYVRHNIVHNEHVVETLKNKGVIFVEELSDVPEESVVILSAHGVSPEVRNEAKERKLQVIDATCPLVMKVHMEAVRFHKEGYTIIYIGHKGHQEVIGTMGEAPMHLVSSLKDVENLIINEHEKVICLTQTTLSLDDTSEMMCALQEKYPHMITPPKEDICYATQNRQSAVKAVSKDVDVVIVVGSYSSSNSKRLVDTVKSSGKEAFLVSDIEDLEEILFDNYENIGITSGASVPKTQFDVICNAIKAKFPDIQEQEFAHLKEDMHFLLPNMEK